MGGLVVRRHPKDMQNAARVCRAKAHASSRGSLTSHLRGSVGHLFFVSTFGEPSGHTHRSLIAGLFSKTFLDKHQSDEKKYVRSSNCVTLRHLSLDKHQFRHLSLSPGACPDPNAPREPE